MTILCLYPLYGGCFLAGCMGGGGGGGGGGVRSKTRFVQPSLWRSPPTALLRAAPEKDSRRWEPRETGASPTIGGGVGVGGGTGGGVARVAIGGTPRTICEMMPSDTRTQFHFRRCIATRWLLRPDSSKTEKELYIFNAIIAIKFAKISDLRKRAQNGPHSPCQSALIPPIVAEAPKRSRGLGWL